MTNIQPVDAKKHQDIRVKKSHSYEHAKLAQFMPINANEFSPASSQYPIFFIKDRVTAKLFSVTLFGFEEGENLFYSQKRWQATYIPAVMQLSPFSMGYLQELENKSSPQNWVACIDEDSQYLSSTDGERVLKDGKASDYFVKIQRDLESFYGYKQASVRFVDRLLELGLVKPIKFNLIYEGVEENRAKSGLQGIYTIDEEGVGKLATEVVQEFHVAGYFRCIYSMLNSQHNLYDLIRRQQASNQCKKLKALQLADQ